MKKDNLPILKVCLICQREVLSKDNFVRVIDYKLGNLDREGFYHTNCFNEKLKGGKELGMMKKQTFALLRKAQEMMGIEPQEIVEIK